jgi:excisionase family DNA binding protein
MSSFTNPAGGQKLKVAAIESEAAARDEFRQGRQGIGHAANRGLLRVEEAAEWLGLGRTKAYELVYRGTLPSVTIGRSRRVPVAALEAFVHQLIENGGVV